MTKRKRISICILTKLLTASSARLFAALPVMLLAVLLSFSPYIVMQGAERDSLYTFRFVPEQGMFYVPYKENSAELERLSALLKQHQKDILAGNIPVFVSGFCRSASVAKENRRLVRERSNRVKAEMIVRNGLCEVCFHTTNFTGDNGKADDVVFVRIVLPEDKAVDDLPVMGERMPGSSLNDNVKCSDSKVELYTSKVELCTSKVDLYEAPAVTDNCYSNRNVESPLSTSANVSDSSVTFSFRGWTLGLNIGIPFFWGDMLSMSADKTYIGISAGLQADYRFSDFFGANLSADYAQGKAGARDYAQHYQLSPSGMTAYSDGTDCSRPYKELYSKISVVNIGLGLDIYFNRFLGVRALYSRFQAVLTPTVYGQFFKADIYNKATDTRFSNGITRPNTVSLGLGGALSFRYRIASDWSLQLKNSFLWMTDNKFDGITTPYGHTRHNVLWMPQFGILWTLK